MLPQDLATIQAWEAFPGALTKLEFSLRSALASVHIRSATQSEFPRPVSTLDNDELLLVESPCDSDEMSAWELESAGNATRSDD